MDDTKQMHVPVCLVAMCDRMHGKLAAGHQASTAVTAAFETCESPTHAVLPLNMMQLMPRMVA